MSVRYIPYQNKLAKLIRSAGGKAFEDAVAAADDNLKSIENSSLRALDDQIEQIRAMAAHWRGRDSAPRLYQAANELVGLGGVCGLPDLSEAAYSLCELIDRSPPHTGPGQDAVQVHCDALRLLRLGDVLPKAERRTVLDGLGDVVRRGARVTA